MSTSGELLEFRNVNKNLSLLAERKYLLKMRMKRMHKALNQFIYAMFLLKREMHNLNLTPISRTKPVPKEMLEFVSNFKQTHINQLDYSLSLEMVNKELSAGRETGDYSHLPIFVHRLECISIPFKFEHYLKVSSEYLRATENLACYSRRIGNLGGTTWPSCFADTTRCESTTSSKMRQVKTRSYV